MMPLCGVSRALGGWASPALMLSSPASLWQGWCQKQSGHSSLPCSLLPNAAGVVLWLPESCKWVKLCW